MSQRPTPHEPEQSPPAPPMREHPQPRKRAGRHPQSPPAPPMGEESTPPAPERPMPERTPPREEPRRR
ncbi:hypothetical protein [Streptomyces smaragdinus]|uniref:hypothetical protein n=1 Tax=Streptomyces smaragdinus TaxID=2585196 RepID=UPI001296F99B|nr:hypothetical protein [Streptomyces smaragdinus]